MGVIRRPLEPPLDPSDSEAREWAREELSKAVYSQGPSLWERFMNWLQNVLDQLAGSGTGALLLPVLIVVLIAAVVGIAFLIGGPVRRRRLASSRKSAEVLHEDDRDEATLRSQADAAAAAGDYATAVLERFRSIIRSLDDRGILQDRRGRTAHEAASEAAAAFGPLAADLRSAGTLFDEVYYGSATPGEQHDAALRELAENLRQATPTPASESTTQAWSAVR